jgi:glycerate kinase
MTRVLIAPDKFKGSLTAAQVVVAVKAGLLRVAPDLVVDAVPVADGGDGTVAAALAAGFDRVDVTADGPTGEPVHTCYGRRDDTAVVEVADVSGLVRLPPGRMAPLSATSRGTGEVIAAAVEAGCRRVVLGIGGSASTDAGAGILQALGARLTDASGRDIEPGGLGLAELAAIDLEPLRARMSGVQVSVACDVDNPLTGTSGAAAVYAPQKGATADQVAFLDGALGRFADVVAAATGADRRYTAGAGAAGGIGFAMLALLDAELRPGIELVLQLAGFDERLAGADLVITGEGSLDEQTLRGKAVVGVASRVRARGIPVVAVCGRSSLGQATLRDAGIEATYRLTDLEPDVDRCIRNASTLLELLGERIALDHVSGLGTQRTPVRA